MALQNSAYVTTGSTGAIGLDVTSGLNAGSFTLGGLSGAVDLATAITGYGSVTNLTLNPQTGYSNTYSGVISNGSGAMTLTKTGAGTQVLSGLNSYTGATNVNVGVLQFTGTSAIGSTSKITVSSGAQAYFGGLAAAFTTAINTPIELNGAGPSSGGALRTYVENGALTFNGTISLLGNSTIFSYAGNCTSTFNNPIDGTGDLTFAAGGASKAHNDVFELKGGSSTYVGNTTITSPGAANAIVRLNGGSLPSATVLTLQDGNAASLHNDVVFDLNGNDQTLAGLTDVAVSGGNGRFVVNGNAALSTLTVNNTVDYTFAGIIGLNNSVGNGQTTGTGNIALIKQGNGIQTLSGANSYTGTTTVTAGTLVINGNQSAATGAVSVSGTLAGSGGTIGGNTTINTAGHLAPGNATANSTGTETITASLTFVANSIFDWDINSPVANGPTADQGTYDKVVNTNATKMNGESIFNVILGAGKTFSDAFWDTDKTWSNVFSGTGLATVNLKDIFTSFTLNGDALTGGVVPGEGTFSYGATGTTLTWTAVPEPTSALVGLLIGAGLLRRRRA